jgi:hypothetical protein
MLLCVDHGEEMVKEYNLEPIARLIPSAELNQESLGN